VVAPLWRNTVYNNNKKKKHRWSCAIKVSHCTYSHERLVHRSRCRAAAVIHKEENRSLQLRLPLCFPHLCLLSPASSWPTSCVSRVDDAVAWAFSFPSASLSLFVNYADNDDKGGEEEREGESLEEAGVNTGAAATIKKMKGNAISSFALQQA
jgi:hypothetical protein